MSELKDLAIKLFGKTISLPQSESVWSTTDGDRHRDQQNSSSTGASLDDKNTSGELNGSIQENDSTNPTTEESVEPATMSGISDDHKGSGAEIETSSPKILKEDPDENNLSQEKTLKKPDKILPCPRCNSMDTKFCYYNNYNVNQPRHFCKNCQRYWTAGGTMRNVPVGSGRRKIKNTSATSYRDIMISDAFHAAHAGASNGIHLPTLKANGTVLTFGTERPLCESMATVLNLAERSHNHLPNGYNGPEQRIAIPCVGKEIAEDYSNGSSSTTTNSTGKGGSADSVLKNCQGGYLPHVPPPFPGPPWPCPWDSAQWRPPPAFSPSGFPVSFYPAGPYWGCTAPSPWNMPWLSPAPSSPGHSALSSSPTSPTLGKHSRNGFILNPSNLVKQECFEDKNEESHILIPKTLRIGDPNEAAKSSIWSTLGIKNEKSDTVSGSRLFKAFPLKGDKKNRIADTSLVLQANPAAFSRSQIFQEST